MASARPSRLTPTWKPPSLPVSSTCPIAVWYPASITFVLNHAFKPFYRRQDSYSNPDPSPRKPEGTETRNQCRNCGRFGNGAHGGSKAQRQAARHRHALPDRKIAHKKIELSRRTAFKSEI